MRNWLPSHDVGCHYPLWAATTINRVLLSNKHCKTEGRSSCAAPQTTADPWPPLPLSWLGLLVPLAREATLLQLGGFVFSQHSGYPISWKKKCNMITRFVAIRACSGRRMITSFGCCEGDATIVIGAGMNHVSVLFFLQNLSKNLFKFWNGSLLNYSESKGIIHDIIQSHQKPVDYLLLSIFCDRDKITTLSATITFRKLLIILQFLPNFL